MSLSEGNWKISGRDDTRCSRSSREHLVSSRPETFQLPSESDMRYQWVVAKMAALDRDEMEELVIDAWRMCVPKGVAREFLGEG